MDKQLHRSRENKMIAGVCGGVAEYFSLDPTIVRIIWAAITLAFLPGGIIAYIIAAVVIPERQVTIPGTGSQSNNMDSAGAENSGADGCSQYNDSNTPDKADPQRSRLFIGGVLIFLGALILAKEFAIINTKYLWPLVFIGIGAYIIYRGGRKKP
ncbi:MAG: PspC domain-containing protein [Acetivibrionales bacterium]|jgi:phage shock protein C